MADSLTDDTLRKILEGKTSTDSSLAIRDEDLRSSVIPAPSKVDFGPLLGSAGDLRFLGNLDDYALWAQSAPATTPRRHRRLAQQKLFYGARVVAEGTDGTLTDGSTTFNTGLTDVSYLSSVFTLADLVLVVSNTTDLAGEDNSTFTSAYGIAGVSGGDITLSRAFSNILTPLDRVYWQVLLPQPVELLYWPGSDFTQATTFFFRKPDEWPIRQSASLNMDSSSATALLTAEGRLEITAEHNDAQTFNAGDWAEVNGEFFYVQDVTFTPGSPNTEVLTLTPFYGAEFPPDILDLPLTIGVVRSTADVVTSPFSDLGLYSGEDLWSADNGDLLESVRVKNLIRPDQVDDDYRNNCYGALLDPESDSDAVVGPGYGLVLFPADGSGNPDLTNAIYDLENVTIDSSISEPQQIFVDYTEGLLQLSHPIADGDDLNPNSYRTADGRALLFSMFVAHNGESLPLRSQGVEDYALGVSSGGTAADKKGNARVGMRVDSNGLEISVPDNASIYHEDELRERELIQSGSRLGGYGVRHEMEHRSPDSGRTMRSELRMGPLSTDDRRRQLIFRPALVTENGDEGTNQPDWRVAEGSKQQDTTTEDNFVNATASTDIISFVANGIPVTVELTNGVTPTAVGLAGQIATAYSNAESAFGRANQEFTATAETDAAGLDFVRIACSGDLYFRNGTAHSDLGLPLDTAIKSQRVAQEWGYNGSSVNHWTWDNSLNLVESDINDVRLFGPSTDYASSLRGAAQTTDVTYPKYVIEGGEASVATGDSLDVTDMTVKTPNFTGFEGQVIYEVPAETLDFTGFADGTYFVFYDFVTEALNTIDRTTGGFDPLFNSVPNNGIPVAQVTRTGGALDAETLFDQRRFAQKTLESSIVTVGTDGAFASLRAACAYIANRNAATGATAGPLQGAFTIKLLEDITIDGSTTAAEVYIPSNVVLDLAGHTITCSNFSGGSGTGPFRLGNPIGASSSFVSTNVTIRNGTIELSTFGTGANAPDLFLSDQGAGTLDAFDVTLEDLRITTSSGAEEVQRFVNVEVDTGTFEPALRMRRVFTEFGTAVINTVVEYTGGASGIIQVDDCVFYAGSSVGTSAAFDISALNVELRLTNSKVLLSDEGGNQLFLDTSGVGGPAGLRLYTDNCLIQGMATSLIETDSSNALPFRWDASRTKIEYNIGQDILRVPGGGSLVDGCILSFTDCEIIDDGVGGVSVLQFDFGQDCDVTFTNCIVSNLTLHASADSSVSTIRIHGCRFLAGETEEQTANAESVSGDSCVLNLDAGVLYMSDTRFQGQIQLLSGATDASTGFIDNCFITGGAGGSFTQHLNLEGGFLNLNNTTMTNTNVGTTEMIRIAEAGTGTSTTPEVVISGCRFDHSENRAILVTGVMTFVTVASCNFDGGGNLAGTHAIEVADQGSSTQINLQVASCQLFNYDVNTTDSEAIVVGNNNERAQFVALFVRSAGSGATDFTISGTGTVDINTESTVRFIP